MKTVMKLEERKLELVQLISNWAKEKMILQPDEVIEIDLRVTKVPRVALKIHGKKKKWDLTAVRAMPVEKIKGRSWSRNESSRITNTLRCVNINTIGELADKGGDILGYRNLGRISLLKIGHRLKSLGLQANWI